jgi:hypothetical protein
MKQIFLVSLNLCVKQFVRFFIIFDGVNLLGCYFYSIRGYGGAWYRVFWLKEPNSDVRLTMIVV